MEIEVEDGSTADGLRYVANRVEQVRVPVLIRRRWRVLGSGPWELHEEGDLVGRYGRFDGLLYTVYQRCYGRLSEHLRLGGWVGIHAGLVGIGGRRTLVVGDKGDGKTTLMLQLLLDGHAVEGDELVLLRREGAVALPRAFHVKPGTDALVPALAPALAQAPCTTLSDGTPIVAFDPVDAGFAAATGVGAVQAVVVLDRGGAGRADLRPLSTVEAIDAVVRRAQLGDDGPADLVRTCASLLADAEGFRLRRGPLPSMAARLAETVGSVAPAPSPGE